jgi:hypothetical protein
MARAGPFGRTLVRSARPSAAALLLCALGVAAGCSSTPSAAPPATTQVKTTTTTGAAPTTTTAAAATTTSATVPAEQSSSVQVQIAGATAIVTFDSADLNGTLQTTGARFSASGTAFDFVIDGVSYSGSPVTTSSSTAGGLISQVQVAATSGGVTVAVSLRSPASHDEFGIGHDTVGVSLS